MATRKPTKKKAAKPRSSTKRQGRKSAPGAVPREHLQRLFDLSSDLFCIADDKGYFVELNPAWQEQFGWTPEELCARPFEEFLHPDDRAPTAATYAAQMHGGAAIHFNNRYRHKDGSYRWLEWNATPMTAEGLIYAVARDVTVTKEMEVELRSLHEVTSADHRWLVEQAPLGIGRTTPEGNFLSANPALISMLGYGSVDEVLQVSLDEQLYADPTVRSALLAELATGVDVVREVEWRRKDGTTLPVLLHKRKVQLQGGEIAFVELVQDLSEQRHLEEQFRHAQRLEAVGRLAGGVAHDFNNLLTVVLGNVDFIKAALPGGAPVRVDLDEIEVAARRAAAVVQQLLAFARKQSVEPKALDINAILAGTDKMLHRLLGEDVELVSMMAPDLGIVFADPGQIEQVLVNLAVNARDAMPGGGKLTIETSNVTVDDDYVAARPSVALGEYVMMAVSDTGEGMTQEVQEHLFEPFYTTKEAGKGTGLGLSTCHGIVRQCGGWIWVYSEVGSGTTFRIYLPRVRTPVHQSVPVAKPRSVGGHETILVIEDEVQVRRISVRILRAAGYDVLEAGDGVEALAVAQGLGNKPIDLVITDMIMPQMGGREVAGRLEAANPRLKVLFTSGYTAEAATRQGTLNKAESFLAKPFEPAMLAAKVREILDGRVGG
ncbi:MAG: PAS domain S-box protein [Gemmatimonadales bacterium]